MRIAVPTETDPKETRVAATPETVKKYVGLGAEVAVQAGAGMKSGITDADYQSAGALVAPEAGATLAGADIVLRVRRPAAHEVDGAKPGAAVIAIMDLSLSQIPSAWREGPNRAMNARCGTCST